MDTKAAGHVMPTKMFPRVKPDRTTTTKNFVASVCCVGVVVAGAACGHCSHVVDVIMRFFHQIEYFVRTPMWSFEGLGQLCTVRSNVQNHFGKTLGSVVP